VHLSGDELDHLPRQIPVAIRKPPVAGVELQHHRERQPGGATLAGDQLVIAVEQRPVLDQLVQVKQLAAHSRKFRVRSETEQTPKRSIGEARSWALKHDLGTGSSDTTGRNGTHALLLPTAARGG
jgi:hypothetical protein